MARIRTIKPEFWANERLSELPEAAHMLAAALLNYADDDGYFNANPALVKAGCFPLRDLSVEVSDALRMLEQIEYLKLLRGTDGRTYGLISGFKTHQRVNRPAESKIHPLIHGGLTEDSVKAHGGLTESSMLNGRETEGKRKGKGKELEAEGETEGNGSSPAVPTVSQPPLDVSGVDWEWVLRVASDVAKRIPPNDDNDRRQWIRFAVLAWSTFSEGWLLDAAEAVLNAKEHRRKRQAHFVGIVKRKASQDGIDEETLKGMMRRIEIPADVWKSNALRIGVKT